MKLVVPIIFCIIMITGSLFGASNLFDAAKYAGILGLVFFKPAIFAYKYFVYGAVSCSRCNGFGYIARFRHVRNGICFRCWGRGEWRRQKGALSEKSKLIAQQAGWTISLIILTSQSCSNYPIKPETKISNNIITKERQITASKEINSDVISRNDINVYINPELPSDSSRSNAISVPNYRNSKNLYFFKEAPEEEINNKTFDIKNSYFISIGSSKNDVLSIQGTPTEINGDTWHYGLSYVRFRNDKVDSWHISELNPINIKLAPTSETDTTADFITIGSTKNDVLSIQGTPTEINGDTWHYGLSYIRFRNDKVDSWHISELNPININKSLNIKPKNIKINSFY